MSSSYVEALADTTLETASVLLNTLVDTDLYRRQTVFPTMSPTRSFEDSALFPPKIFARIDPNLLFFGGKQY